MRTRRSDTRAVAVAAAQLVERDAYADAAEFAPDARALDGYAGAGSRLTLDEALALDARRWAFQPKIDGCYVEATTDGDGVLTALRYRSGEVVTEHDAGDLLGLRTGARSARLHGELTAHTSAGIAERERLGFTRVHVFDVSTLDGVDLVARGYAARYGELQRWQAEVECYSPSTARDRSRLDATGRAHDDAGRYVRDAQRDLRRLPIVPLVRGVDGARALWRQFVDDAGGEGLVAVRLDGRLGGRGAKRKIKSHDSLDCIVVSVGARAASLSWAGRTFAVSASGAVGRELQPGAVVEVRADGFYPGTLTPRFPRIVRVRADLRA